MHFCTARIHIGGDNNNIYFANEFDPVSWPEISILQLIHGGDSVDTVVPFADVEQSGPAERHRLALKYGEEVVAEVFGGKQPPHQLEAPRATLRPGARWRNPLTGLLETTGQAESDDAVAAQSTEVLETESEPPRMTANRKR